MNRSFIVNTNINSISNNYDQLKLLISGKVDLLVIQETKLDSAFPTSQFLIECYSEPYYFDRDRKWSSFFIYVQEDIPIQPLTDHKLQHHIERRFVELNLRKCKWFSSGSYHLPSQSGKYFLTI